MLCEHYKVPCQTHIREIIAVRHPSDGAGTTRASMVPLCSLATRTDMDAPAAMDEILQLQRVIKLLG